MSEAECVAKYVCPICRDSVKRGTTNHRRGLQEHLRRSKDPVHVLWRNTVYNKYFSKKRLSLQDADVAQRISAAFEPSVLRLAAVA